MGARLVLALASLLATLVVLELGLRAFGYEPERFKSTARLTSADERLRLDCYPTNPRGYFDVDLRTAAARAKYLSLAPRRYDAVAARAPWAVEFRYNADGFRGADVAGRRPDVRRLVVVGDSFTEGQGVKEEDTYVAVLESLLDAAQPGGWEAVNCGRRAADFPALLEVFDKALAYRPDVVLYAMVLNDADRSEAFQARQTYVNDWILDRGRMLIGRPDERLRALDSRLAALVSDRVAGWRVGRETARWYREMYEEPNRDGWLRTQAHLRAMDRRARAQGASFAVALWPLLVGLDGRYPFEEAASAVARACAEAGLRFHDLLPALRGRPAESLWVHPVDRHPNETAHRLAGEALAHFVTGLASAR